MKRLSTAAVALLCALGFAIFGAAAQAQLTTITASNLKIGGTAISTGKVLILPVNTTGTAISFAQGGGGLNGPFAFSCTVTAGALSGCSVPDTALTNPANILYKITVIDTSTGQPSSGLQYTLQGVAGVTGSPWALDAYGPPTSTSAYQQIQISSGTTVPSSCNVPSVFTKTNAGGAFYYCYNGTYTLTGSASVTAASVASALSGQTGCATAGYVYSPQSNTCVAQGSASVTATNVTSAISTQTGCTTAGFVWSPQSNSCIAQTPAVSASNVVTAIRTQTGCNTAGYVWVPQSNTCVAPSGGSGLPSLTSDGTTTTSTQPISAPGFTSTATTPGIEVLSAGAGSPSLPANSAALIAPVAGGTSYALKMPATLTAGVAHAAAPATGVDGVNEGNLTFGPVANGDLANPSTTVNGQTCTFGGACTITSSVLSGSSTPQGQSCAAGAVYTQTIGAGVQYWDCSPTGFNWSNRTNGSIVYAGSASRLIAKLSNCYPLTEGSGVALDHCGSNNLTLGGGAAWNGTNGVNFTTTSQWMSFASNPLANNKTYQLCYIPPVVANSPVSQTIIGDEGDSYSVIGSDIFGATLIYNATDGHTSLTNTSLPYLPNGPVTCTTYILNGSNANVVYSGTVASPGYKNNHSVPWGNGVASIGGFPDLPNVGYVGTVYSAYIYGSVLSPEEIQHEAAVAASELTARSTTIGNGWQLNGSGTALFLGALGDSLTYGLYDTVPGGFVTDVQNALGGNMPTLNLAVPGQTCQGIATFEAPALQQAAALYPAQKRVSTLWCLTNELPISSITTEYGYVATTHTVLHNAGFGVIDITTPPKPGCVSTCESGTNGRVQYNAYLIAQNGRDGLVDLGTDPRFSNPAYNYAFRFPPDSVHFNSLGYAVLGGRVVTEMNRMRMSTLGDLVQTIPFSATPIFDLSQGLHQSMVLTGNVTTVEIKNYNQGTEFTLDFIQDGTGSRTVGLGAIGSGATATAPLTGTTPVFTLGSGGTLYKPDFPPYIQPSGGTCTTYPVFIPTLSGGAVTGATTQVTGVCTVAPTLTFVSNEPTWHGAMTVGSTAGKTSTQTFHFDATTANIYANNAGVTNQ